MKSQIIEFKNYQSTSESLRITKHEDGSFTFTFIDDKSNGTRSYGLASSDLEAVKTVLEEL